MSMCDGDGQLYREIRQWVGELLRRGIYLPPRLVIDVNAIREDLVTDSAQANHNREPLRKMK